MAKATFPAQSQTVAESAKPADGDGFTPADHRNAYSAVYQGDLGVMRPRAKSPATLAINVAPAELEGFFRNVYWNNTHVKFAGGDSPNFTAPSSNPRIDLLALDVSGGPTGVLTRIAGTEAASPAEPALPDLKTNIPLCYVYNRVTQSKVVNFEDKDANPTEGYLYRDVRPWVPPGGATTLGGTPTSSAVGDSASEGASQNAAKADHRHGRESAGTPVAQAFGDSAAQGSGPSVSYGDHRHGMPAKPDGGYTNMQVFTSSGTWTRPSGVNKVLVKVIGGGGGGAGGGSSAGQPGGGGGGGAYGEEIVTVTGDVSITAGGGGGGGSCGGSAGSAGSSGGTSSFGSLVSAGGGGGGQWAGSGGFGGTSSAVFNISGAAGTGVSGSTPGRGGAGGGFAGDIGKGGDGGSGGNGNACSGGGGGSGAAGRVIVYWAQ